MNSQGFRLFGESSITSHLITIVACAFLCSCGERILPNLDLPVEETTPEATQTVYEAGDIILVAGGSVVRSTSPFPPHTIASFNPTTGALKEVLYTADSTELLWGAQITPDNQSLVFTVDGSIDHIASLDPITLSKGVYLLDATMSGATVRSLALLPDDSWLIAEARNAIEKYDSNLANLTGSGFRLTTSMNYINRILPVSSDRFMVFQSAHTDDRPLLYSNSNASSATVINLGLTCANNCDIHDAVELPNGNFVFSVMNASYNSLILTNSSFVVQGQFFKDEIALPGPSTMKLLDASTILVCTFLSGVCEKVIVNGNTGSLATTGTFINHPVYSRNITDIVVVPENFYDQ